MDIEQLVDEILLELYRRLRMLPDTETEKKKELDISGRRVITEAYLQTIYSRDLVCIHIGKRCIITPLAADFIKDYGLQIHRI